MLTGIIIFIIIGLIGGIISLSSQATPGHKSRKEFLTELSDFWEGELKPLEGQEESFKVEFNFEGRKFIFEDVEEKGFKDKINRVYLKLPTALDLNLYFTQKEQRSVQMKTMIVSEIPDEPIKEDTKVNVPKELKDFHVHTNNPRAANKILEDLKARRILARLKNMDSRGYPSIPLRILGGVIILEFYAEGSIKPRLSQIYHNISALEHHLKTLFDLDRVLETLKFI